jgi:ABC-type methionine transport system permease subunit
MEDARRGDKEAGTLLAIFLVGCNQIASRVGMGGVGRGYDSH